MTWLALLALLGYCLLSWFYFNRISRAEAHALRFNTLATTTLVIALTCHATAITLAFHLHPWHFGASEALSLTALLSIATYFAALPLLPLKGIEPPLTGFAALLLGISLLLPTGHQIQTSPGIFSQLHFATALLTQPLLINATGIAILIKFSDRQLHSTARGALTRNLPPVLTLERLLFVTVSGTFLILSIALVSGMIASREASSAVRLLSHKVIFSTLAWGILGTLLLGHHRFGWRGRKAANWTLTGSAFLFLGYIGTRLVLEAVLQR
ncbi:cytochrome C assembly family protein [Chitinilyticum aquatile]|uniref:cytochrome C assembly family protein n=1 Tax=Chitinilyticum aquatile TaxID=362520 RepID=UPI0006877F17|nr:cytochrome c biogenesis protein CcsA [Chitinilyticum aquatile]